MKDVLNKIVGHKKLEVHALKKTHNLDSLQDLEAYHQACRSITESFQSRPAGIIAEFKKKSPSVQNININADVNLVADIYKRANVTAMSVLTDQYFFGGQNQDLINAKSIINVPVLRKDFTIDSYQLHEAKSIGADLILLIAEILSKSQVQELAHEAKSIGLQVLLEMHSNLQLEKIDEHIDIIGVNNRNLDTFVVDYRNSIALYDLLPSDKLKISESGIKTLDDAVMLKQAGFDGFLIGETFMKANDPLAVCTAYVNQLS